jgi:ribosomal subunit interface protein
MDVAVHGRHVEVPVEVRELAERKVAHLDRYLSGLERVDVCFSAGPPGRLGDPCTCELVVEGGGHVIRVHGSGARQPAAFQEALDRATLSARRMNKKLVDRSRPRHRVNGSKPEREPEPADSTDEVGGL